MKITIIVETEMMGRKKVKTATVELPDIDSFAYIDHQAAADQEQDKIGRTITTIVEELKKQ